MKAVVAAFNQEKALVGAFSVIVQLRRLIANSYSGDRCTVQCEGVGEKSYLRGCVSAAESILVCVRAASCSLWWPGNVIHHITQRPGPGHHSSHRHQPLLWVVSAGCSNTQQFTSVFGPDHYHLCSWWLTTTIYHPLRSVVKLTPWRNVSIVDKSRISAAQRLCLWKSDNYFIQWPSHCLGRGSCPGKIEDWYWDYKVTF